MATLARRDNGEKQSAAWGDLAASVPALLEQIQGDMLARAKAQFDACVETETTWEGFMAALGRRHMVLAPW